MANGRCGSRRPLHGVRPGGARGRGSMTGHEYEVPTWQTGSDGLAGGLMLCRVLVWHLAGDMRDQRLPVWCQHANCNGGQQSSLIAPWAFLFESTSQSCRSLDRCASHTFDGSICRDMKRATLDLISARRLNRRHTCSLTRRSGNGRCRSSTGGAAVESAVELAARAGWFGPRLRLR